MHGEEERTIAGELQKIVESWGQKTLYTLNCQTAPTSPHVVWEGFKKKNLLAHTKTNSRIFSYQTRLEVQMGLASMVR